jgi:hypothetical protein
VFDIYKNYRSGQFDFVDESTQQFAVSSPFSDGLYDDLQRALTLVWFYRLRPYRPLYFTTFLLLPRSDSLSDPFILKKVPVRRNCLLCIRTTIQGWLDIAIDYRRPVPPGSYVLVPPHEHAFRVVASGAGNLTLLSVDREISTIRTAAATICLLTRPPVLLGKFYAAGRPVPSVGRFATEDLYNFPEDAIDSFLSSRFATDRRASRAAQGEQEQIAIIEFPEMSIPQIISQLIADPRERDAICGGASGFPSRHAELRMLRASFLSFFRFDFGIPDGRPPHHAHTFLTGTSITYQRLGIPEILVNCCGRALQVPANVVCDQWEEKRYQPISGSKSGHFIVVSMAGLRMSEVRTFFSQLCHIYQILQFGQLTPFPRFDAFYQMPRDALGRFIRDFFSDQLLSEYQHFPILTFIVGPVIFDEDFGPHSIISYVRPESIATASAEELRTFAFVVYSRIRIFSPCPFGMIDIGRNDSASFFFGFRYQPPFMLKRASGNRMTIHIAWDFHLSTWIDDIGSILHFFPDSPMRKLTQIMADIVRFLDGVLVKFTLSVFAEGISAQTLDAMRAEFRRFDVTIFTVSPQPAIQVLFKEDFEDDAIIFTTPEQFREAPDSELRKPDATCFVAAHSLPAYCVSIYQPEDPVSAKDLLYSYVRDVSGMSWLSVKPGSEKRTMSLPPHIVALIRKNAPEVSVFARYEFLPSTERI